MPPRSVLISGAGIAGPTLAHLLSRQGVRVTMIETSQTFRSSGSPVDVRGAASAVAQTLGLLEKIKEAATEVDRFTFIGPEGQRLTERANVSNTGDYDLEIPRGDLCRILVEALPSDVELINGEKIEQLAQSADGVEAVFSNGERKFYELVVGADGLHSGVRRLGFGPETAYVKKTGVYVATVRLGSPVESSQSVQIYNEPGKALILHPARGDPLILFLFRSGTDCHYRDTVSQRDLIASSLRNVGWRANEFSSIFSRADDFYFDAVSMVRVNKWSRGRIVLLGDAASCASLFGEGSSLAMIGAGKLAAALLHNQDVRSALEKFEREQRPLVMARQRGVSAAIRFVVPSSSAGIFLRNQGLKVANRFIR